MIKTIHYYQKQIKLLMIFMVQLKILEYQHYQMVNF